MHFGILTIIKKTDNIEQGVAETLAPFGDGKEWDWYQIGGRHTGCLDEYEPEKDPRNIETCTLCGGTGTRRDVIEAKEGYCNGCSRDKKQYGLPSGQRVKWPTQWARHNGDIVPLNSVTQETLDSMFYGICVDGNWFVRERFESKPWAENPDERYKLIPQELPPMEWLQKTYPDHLAVVVDCHN